MISTTEDDSEFHSGYSGQFAQPQSLHWNCHLSLSIRVCAGKQQCLLDRCPFKFLAVASVSCPPIGIRQIAKSMSPSVNRPLTGGRGYSTQSKRSDKPGMSNFYVPI